LPTSHVIQLLQKLIALTSARDAYSLEVTLAQTLFDLVAPDSVHIYRVVDFKALQFSSLSIGGAEVEQAISPLLTQQLTQCIQAGTPVEYTEANHRRNVFYPLVGLKSQIVAVLVVAVPEGDNHFAQTTEMLLKIYQNFIALIYDNERDTLTGLLNRKTFEAKINKVLEDRHSAQLRKQDQVAEQYFLAIFDIDHFKRVNDNFGHVIGDEVLLMFSQQMTQAFRGQDLLFRFGGEEFVAVFACDSAEAMAFVVNRFREMVQEYRYPQVGHITVSCGFTKVADYDLSTTLIERADLALYYAKNNGRNRVCDYEQLIAQGELTLSDKSGDIEFF
jgi:diguanylate cyclase (GGDEF)-like protein